MHQPVGDYIYTINRQYQGKEYMLFDINVRKGKANQWTTSVQKALVFYSEEEAKDLVKKFSLPNVHIGKTTVGG